MNHRRGVRFSFLWGIALMFASGILGGVYGKVLVDKIRLHTRSEASYRPSVSAELAKTDKTFTDRFESSTPVYRISNKK